MNVPLNIDIQQILLHLFNFVILAFGLYMLLYKPVKKFMDKRIEYYSQLDKEANEKLKKAEDLKNEYQSQLDDIDKEIKKRKAAARKEADDIAAAQLQSAKYQAERIMSDARASANAEKQRIVASAGKEIAELASSAADKLLKEALGNE